MCVCVCVVCAKYINDSVGVQKGRHKVNKDMSQYARECRINYAQG